MQSIEIAVFEASDPERFVVKQHDLHRSLGSLFGGYVASIGLRSATEPNVFSDVVLWESDDAAQAAAAAIGEVEELAWFHPEIASVRFFDHLAPVQDARASLATIGAAPVAEIVLLKPANVDGFAAAHEALHAELAIAEVVVAELRLDMNENGVVGDLNAWTTPDAMHEMGSQMMARSEFGPVFDPDNEMVLFMPFTVNVAQ